MSIVVSVLVLAARRGRYLLILGLAMGVLLPGLAAHLVGYIRELVGLLLFLAVVRIGPRAALGGVSAFGQSLGIVGLYQVAMPLLVAGGLALTGLLTTPAGLALVLTMAAAPLTGSPNLAILSGAEPAPALRLVVLGTALLPLTVIPVVWVLPAIGGMSAVLGAAVRLLAVIALAGTLAMLFRRAALPDPGPRALLALDGLSALTMAVIVIGLMSAVGPALSTTPLSVAGWLALAFAANLVPQLLAAGALTRIGQRDGLGARSIVAGNRNIALFLVALPEEVMTPLLMFIGCYQVPMYMTPMLMSRLYRRMEER